MCACDALCVCVCGMGHNDVSVVEANDLARVGDRTSSDSSIKVDVRVPCAAVLNARRADSSSASCGDGAAKHHRLNGVSGRRKWRFVSVVSCGPQGDFLNTTASWRLGGGGRPLH